MENRHPMTRKQKETYDFIVKFWKVEDRNPTLREMQAGLVRGEQVSPPRNSHITPYRAVKTLVKKGYIEEVVDKDIMNNRPYWRPV